MEQRTPERIYNWLNTQLSIARHYGGCKYNGADYVIAYDEEGQPLVRKDVKYTRKAKAAKKQTPVSGAPELPLPANTAISRPAPGADG